jgi:hypothetical protein
MKQTIENQNRRSLFALGASLLLIAAGINNSFAYQYYSDPVTGDGNCFSCHGNFRGSTSTKVPATVFPGGRNHDMHRVTANYPLNMATACNLCHGSADTFPVEIGKSAGTVNNTGIGCNGCHNAVGLRKHHLVNGVTGCITCHPGDGEPPAETVKPPYYGTPDTRARNSANDVLVANTNENWSIGDFLGLDNDGNNLYDLADYAVGPFRLLSATLQGNDVVVTWLTAGGRTNWVQASPAAAGPYTNVSVALPIPGVGLVTNSFLEVGGLINPLRFYRLSAQDN